MNEEGDVNDPATLAHIALVSNVVEKKRIFDTLSRFAVEQNELLTSSVPCETEEVLAPFTSVAFIEGKITNCDELLVKLSTSQDQFYAERTREQTCEMLRKRQRFLRRRNCSERRRICERGEIEHRETVRVLSEKFESLRNITDGEPKSRVVEGRTGGRRCSRRETERLWTCWKSTRASPPRTKREEKDGGDANAENEKEIERDREEREKAKGELESWLLKIEEMERLEEELQDAEEVEEEKEEEEEEEEEKRRRSRGEKSTNVASSSSTSGDNTTSSSQQRIQIRTGIDSGMPVIEEGFEKDGEDRGVRSGDGESKGAEKPMSKFMMRQLGLL